MPSIGDGLNINSGENWKSMRGVATVEIMNRRQPQTMTLPVPPFRNIHVQRNCLGKP